MNNHNRADRYSLYLEFSKLIGEGRISAALQLASDHFRDRQQYDELFEIEKCRIRLRHGLPIRDLLHHESLDLPIQHQLEEQMLDLCREIGTLHFRRGNISRGWMYLQPLMDRDFVEELFRSVEPHDENIEELIEIGLGHWAAPMTGYRLLIQTRGTCNAITFFDSQIAPQEHELRGKMASQLVDHVYRELTSNVLAWLAEQPGMESVDAAACLEDLVASYPFLFANCGHHLDVSHLASIVRIARFCDDAGSWEQARQLAAYGCQLDDELKYSGELPFEDLFESHRVYFCALTGTDQDRGIEYFLEIFERSRDPRAGNVLAELYRSAGDTESAIRTLIRVGEAVENRAAMELVDLAADEADYQQISNYFRENDDLAAFCIAQLVREQRRKGDVPDDRDQ